MSSLSNETRDKFMQVQKLLRELEETCVNAAAGDDEQVSAFRERTNTASAAVAAFRAETFYIS
jgi:hypothetical protein